MTSPSPDRVSTPDQPAAPPQGAPAAGPAPPRVVSARQAVLAAVVGRPTATSVELATATGFSYQAVHAGLLELEAAGLLRRQPGYGPGRRGRTAGRWYPTESAAEHPDLAALAASATRTGRPAKTDRNTTRPAPHPLLTGLLDVLPAPGTPLHPDQRRRWMAAADLALTLLHPDPPDEPSGDCDRPLGRDDPG